MIDPSTRELALMIDDLRRQVADLSRVSGAGRGSIVGGALTAYDSDDEAALLIGEQWDGSVTTAELIGPIPPVPTRPTLAPGLSSVVVHWDGTFEPDEDGDLVVAPMDFSRVEVHASTDPDFTAEFGDTLIGTFETPRGGDQLCPLPDQGLFYVRLVCRTLPGNAGSGSDLAEVTTLVLPGTSDGDAPTGSVTPSPLGRVDGVYLSWEPLSNPDPLIYRVYARDNPDVRATFEDFVGETTSTGLMIVALPGEDPVPLPYDADTYFRVVAFDADGPGPLGGVVRSRPSPASGDAIQTTDGDPPAESPAPTLIPGLGVVFARWRPVINNDFVSYRVYASATDPTVETVAANLVVETAGTQVTIKAYPDGSPLDYDRDVYVRVVAFDADDEADPGSVTAARPLQVTNPDIAAWSVSAQQIQGNEINGDKFVGQVVLASTIATGVIDDNPDSLTYGQVIGQRVEIGPEGLSVVDAAGNALVRLPTNPVEEAFISAGMVATRLRVLGNLSIEGEDNVIATGSALTLGVGVVAPSATSTVGLNYDAVTLARTSATAALGTFALDYSQIAAMGDFTGGRVLIAQQVKDGVRVWLYGLDGKAVRDGSLLPVVRDFVGWSDCRGVWRHPDFASQTGMDAIGLFGRYRLAPRQTADWAALVRNPDVTDIRLNLVPTSGDGAIQRNLGTRRPTAYYDESRERLVIAELLPGNNAQARGVEIKAYRTNNGISDLIFTNRFRAGMFATDAELGSVVGGSDFDFDTSGRVKIMFHHRDTPDPACITSVNDNAAVQVENGWPVNGRPRVMCWVTGDEPGRFVSIDNQGLMTRYTDWKWTQRTARFYYGHTLYDSDLDSGTPGHVGRTHETTLGGRGVVVPAPRARLQFSVPAVPDKGGSDDPNAFRLYGTLRLDGSRPGSHRDYRGLGTFVPDRVGFPSTIMIVKNNEAGDPPPDDNDFPDSIPGRIRSTAVSSRYGRHEFEVNGLGGGHWHRLAPPGIAIPYLGVGGDIDATLILPEVLPGWLRLTNDLASKAAYPALYAIVQDRFGNGSEPAGFFRLPDFRDRSPVGVGSVNLGQTDGAAYGATRSSLWTHEHDHGPGTLETFGPRGLRSVAAPSSLAVNVASDAHTHDITGRTGVAGSPRHPFVAVNWIVKT